MTKKDHTMVFAEFSYWWQCWPMQDHTSAQLETFLRISAIVLRIYFNDISHKTCMSSYSG